MQRLDHWRRSLLDLTLRNRLLDARDGRTSIALPACDPAALAAALEAGTEVGFDGIMNRSPDGSRAAEIPPAELEKSLTAMQRAARESLQEGGAHTLWAVLGVLRWREAGADDDRHAPLLLWPVELKKDRSGAKVRLASAGDEPKLNETLLEKLRADLGVTVTLPEELEVGPVLDAFAAAVAGRAGWEVQRVCRLGIFSFTKFVMWLDLGARAETLLDTALCRHLAEHSGQPFPPQGEMPTAEVLPAESFTPLDADATQLAAVRAAEEGRTFVLQGPPGTGKSQTIANLIAQCLARGKTVLFVSEKMAALEVVQRRLAGAGLGDFCLELHSHKAKKRAVLDELGRVLDRAWRPAGAVGGADDKLLAARRGLDDVVHDLHEPTPLGLSVHEALARLVALREVPRFPRSPDGSQGPGAAAVPEAAEARWLGECKDALARFAQAYAAVGAEAHPWRDSTLAEWSLSTADAVGVVLIELEAAIRDLEAALAEVDRAIPGLRAARRTDLEALGVLAAVAARSPRPGGELVAGSADAEEWLELAKRRRALAADLAPALIEATELPDEELTTLSARFRRWAHRFPLFRWLALRTHRARVRALLPPGPRPDDTRLADDLDATVKVRIADRKLAKLEASVRRWLGQVSLDDHDAVERAIAWTGEVRAAFEAVKPAFGDPAAAWRAMIAQVSDGNDPVAPSVAWPTVERAVARWTQAIGRLRTIAGVDAPGEGPLPWLAERLPAWRGAVPALRDWTAYVRSRSEVAALGLAEAAGACERGEIAGAQLAAAWERAVLLAWTDRRIGASDALRAFHGPTHHARITEFIELDRASLATARSRLVVRLADRVPKVAPGVPVDDDGEVGTLMRERKKQRRHLPLRTLFARMPNLLGRLKPCLLMSPLSVAQYLDPSLPRFDLVVFDEASQIPTADAIGALARANAAVVVGDSRQLPPTRFFEPGERDERDDSGDPDEYVELESILDECVAARLPELRLGWHYRSRHEDLIAFSNHRYYDDRLHVFPTAATKVADLGVSWRRVEGVYDRAGTRTNRVEAEALVADVIARLRDPLQQKRSLGVVTFSRAQQTLIEDLLDEARDRHPELEPFFTEAAEPLLVKNLETIQGDERDVVLFSIGYGPDAAGKVTMNFGPLNRDGGERRLNVAVTRAREQLVVFSSIDPEAIGAEVAALGVRHLADLLEYVRRGGGAATSADLGMPSPLVAAVADSLIARGWTVRPQVGCAGYRLDLAVVDPDDPGHFLLAIECDGAAYASAPTARDRDRLRAQVLGALGWRLHRIWALDWWHDPEKEAARVQSAVIAALAASRQARKGPSSGPIKKSAPVPVPVSALVATPREPQLRLAYALSEAPEAPSRRVATYRAASVPAGRRTPDDLHEPRYEIELGRAIDQVLEVEAPIHVDLLSRRVGAYFGIGRISARVVERIREVAATRARVGDPDDPDAVWRTEQDSAVLPPVRAAGSAAETRREAAEIPLAEVASAAAIVLGRNVGMTMDDLARETARVLGYARLGERVQKRMRAGIDLLATRGGCTIDGARAALPD